jgi:outer membrane lipoprotein-sorting protein
MNRTVSPYSGQATTLLKYLLLTLALTALVCPAPAAAGDPTPREILQKADQARGNVEGIVWEIEIVSIENNREQQRRLRVTAKNYNSLAEFLAPAKVKGQKVLMRDRNMWFIKPGLRKPVPLSPRQKLLGMASNGDIASTDYAGDYEVEAMTSSEFNGEACFQFDLRAINKKVTYDRITYWVSKNRMVGVKADFFTVSGKLFKSATFDYDNRITIDGRAAPFVSKMTITNALLKENVTVMSYTAPKTGPVSDAIFNLNLLVQ